MGSLADWLTERQGGRSSGRLYLAAGLTALLAALLGGWLGGALLGGSSGDSAWRRSALRPGVVGLVAGRLANWAAG
jgi:hypothetical protein